MYRANTDHQQIPLFSGLDELPEKQRERLENSWAGVFYRECFVRVNEGLFAVLYSEEASRPNVAVNVLVGLEMLKAGFGWSDSELYDAFTYNVQVRYALGYRNLGEGHFELRTLYNFRQRVTEYMQETGENLFEKVFEQITDEQIEALELKTGKLRMDSTQIGSNIRQMSRLQLLVEVMQRMGRALSESDRAHYAELLKPYLKGSSGQYVYHLKADEGQSHLQAIGQVMAKLVSELEADYAADPAYHLLVRVFGEHFVVSETELRSRQGQELSAASLQSPDDQQATYRYKSGKGYQGYVTNVTETCDPENDLQLIVKVQTAANNTDDAALLEAALPNLVERTALDEMYTDGGYNSPAGDEALKKAEVALFQSAIRGAQPDPEKLNLADFTWESDEQGEPLTLICPNDQTVAVKPARAAGRYTARFDASTCADCPLLDSCPTQLLKRTALRVLRFSQQDLTIAHRRQRQRTVRGGLNLRSAVEATVRSLKHPFGNGKVPVRGQSRVSILLVASAAMCNVRRIWRYQLDRLEAETTQLTAQGTAVLSGVVLWLRRLAGQYALIPKNVLFQPARA